MYDIYKILVHQLPFGVRVIELHVFFTRSQAQFQAMSGYKSLASTETC